MLIEQLALLSAILLGFSLAGGVFAWLAWHTYKARRLPGVAVLWLASAAAGASVLAAWAYAAAPPGVAPRPFAIGLPLLLVSFAGAGIPSIRRARAGAKLTAPVLLSATALQLAGALAFALLLVAKDALPVHV
ncbi:hypothetical protein [Lysobacter claricitrinus]|uniref:hypothetical protein n=1 Tax=Lysobacter claricitrinus TaxID=3367728 RepID=UPI0037DB7737